MTNTELLLAKILVKEGRIKARCASDPWYFITKFCQTLEEHDRQIKPFPDYPYLKHLLDLLLTEKLLIIEKSRKMLITWLLRAFSLWDILFHANTLIFYQSETEEDAKAFIERTTIIYQHLPLYLQRSDYTTSACHIEFPEHRSHLWGVSGNPNNIRMHTASRVILDEWQKHQQAKEGYKAALPTVDGGGQLVAVMTAGYRDFAYRMAYDLEK